MNFLLTLIVLALTSALFFYPLSPELHQPLQSATLALLGLLALLQLAKFFRGKNAEAPQPAPEREKPAEVEGPSVEAEVEAAVVQLLARLQDKGRLVDFVMEDITPYSNEQIGAGARVIHQGCREVLLSCFDIVPLHAGEEQDAVSFSGDYDAASYRLVGKVPEQPPFEGTVLHRGWKTTKVELPRLTREAKEGSARQVIAAAEVEIG